MVSAWLLPLELDKGRQSCLWGLVNYGNQSLFFLFPFLIDFQWLELILVYLEGMVTRGAFRGALVFGVKSPLFLVFRGRLACPGMKYGRAFSLATAHVEWWSENKSVRHQLQQQI